MLIKVRVTAGARAEKIIRKSDDHFVVSVKQEAERNMANERVLEIFRAMHPNQSVRLVKGHQSPSKIIEIGTLK
jgi:uncharacterized protein YggU (UPF0235/DUF167 family)